MRKKLFKWLEKEFVALSAESQPAKTAKEEAQSLFRTFNEELREHGLSLENTVRTRLWARDRKSRDLASSERVKILSDKARSASSSYIAPVHFDSNACVAVDLLAMRPASSNTQKQVCEYDPPIVPVRFIVYDSVVILSGVTTVLPTLDQQMANILPRIEGSLRDAGSSWDRAAKVSFYLHRSQNPETLRELFEKTVRAKIPRMEFAFVDGYSAEGKLIEVEVTATT